MYSRSNIINVYHRHDYPGQMNGAVVAQLEGLDK